jgi:hypothetical protein
MQHPKMLEREVVIPNKSGRIVGLEKDTLVNYDDCSDNYSLIFMTFNDIHSDQRTE